MLAALALVFDVTSVLALMYPGRERVEMTGSDGAVYIYACKPGAAGETPHSQAEKAQAAFEENVQKFAQALVGDIMNDFEMGTPSLQTGIVGSLKMNSWARANHLHLEKEYGCALLGEG